MDITTILLLIALICFAIATLNFPVPRVSIGWLGLFFVALSWLVT